MKNKQTMTAFLLACAALAACSQEGNLAVEFGSEGHEFGQLYYPTDMAADKQGNLIIADAYNHRVQKFSSQGKPLQSWDELSGEDRLPGAFNVANAVEVDAAGRICVVDFYNIVCRSSIQTETI